MNFCLDINKYLNYYFENVKFISMVTKLDISSRKFELGKYSSFRLCYVIFSGEVSTIVSIGGARC
ncbi:hypothetical protein EBI01_07075 [Marinomonas rhizomae]|uniref:Uncharacterized protein n=1 Tax=Marinomonas rhizomae TaxID=491948 RepID=A0A366J969_9GAMM|nr:hypothetical protein DFP80_106137 [Marinomonas rhizomae]RNF74043.1 hypothetical protein EBI01_07075 [Marinomonas rhizomae]